jgi:DNA primase
MKMEGLSFPESLETLGRPLDLDLSGYLVEDESEGERVAFHRANEVAAKVWQDSLWHQDRGKTARQYLLQRGFQEEVLRRFEVGYAPRDNRWFSQALRSHGVDEDLALRCGLWRQREGHPPFAYFYNRLIFPIKNIAQRVVGFGGRLLDRGEPKYLNSSDSPFFTKGKLLYGFALSRMSVARLKTAILVEGYLDLLALVQAGFGNVVATCGTAFTWDQARLIRRGCPAVVMLFDGDRAGLQAAVKASHLALGVGLEPRVARLPDGEDPASFLQTKDRGALEAVLANAENYLPFLKTLVREKGGDRQSKERALRQALKSIALVHDPIRQEYLLQEAAELFDIHREVLRNQLDKEAQARERARHVAGQPIGEEKGEIAVGPSRQTERKFLSLAAINRPRIEATLLAHVLRDPTGEAARLMLELISAESFSTPEAEALRQELALWWKDPAGPDLPPAQFVQDRWHQKGGSFQKYVSDLLTQEIVPEKTDFTRVVRDCLGRLQQTPLKQS